MKLKPLLISFSLLAFTGAAYAQQQKEQMNEKETQSTQSQPSQGSTSASGSASASGSTSQSAQKDEQKSESQSAAAGASGSAQAQQSTETQQSAQTESKSAQQSAQQEQDQPGQSAAAGASGSAQSQGGMTIDQVKDMKIVDAQGKDLGQIEDVVIDLTSGKVHAAVLSFGGFMGVGEKHYAFQTTELKRGKQKNQLVLNVDKQKLENAEGFEKGQWPGMDDEYWRNVGGKQAGAGGGAQSGQMNLIRASELKGKEVQDKTGNKVGEVQAVMIDLTQGQVRNIAVNVEGGGRAMVPAKSIKATGTEDRLVLDMDAQKLKQQAQRSGGQKQRGQSGAAGGTMGSQQTQGERPQPQGTTK